MKPLLTVTLTLLLLITWATAIPSEMDLYQVTEEVIYYPKLFENSYFDRRLQDTQLASRAEVDRGKVFVATAYTHVRTPGVADINGTGDGITATGAKVQEGIVAVDPTVIPLKSRVYIESDFPGVTGWYRAEDVGSAIQGNRIDIFRESRKTALAFGKREVRAIVK